MKPCRLPQVHEESRLINPYFYYKHATDQIYTGSWSKRSQQNCRRRNHCCSCKCAQGTDWKFCGCWIHLHWSACQRWGVEAPTNYRQWSRHQCQWKDFQYIVIRETWRSSWYQFLERRHGNPVWAVHDLEAATIWRSYIYRHLWFQRWSSCKYQSHCTSYGNYQNKRFQLCLEVSRVEEIDQKERRMLMDSPMQSSLLRWKACPAQTRDECGS